MDADHFDFQGVQVTGVPDADADIAFDIPELQLPELSGQPGLSSLAGVPIRIEA
jgi:hypothetical protein